jgi:hypothetical protein
MINRRRLIPTILVVALVALCLPVMAAAQGSYDPWGSYGRGNDNRRNDDYRNGRYDRRTLRESVKRVKDRSDDFKDHLDSALDRSRYDDSQREDRINEVTREFERAADRLEDRYDDGKNLSRSSNEARSLLQLGSQIDRFMGRNRLDGRAETDWARIRQDLQVIANAYGFNWSDFDDSYYRNGDNNRRRDDDNRRRVNNRRTNYPW